MGLTRKATISIILGLSVLAPAQEPLWRDTKPAGAKLNAVKYLYPEQVTLPAGKPTAVELHFRIAQGLHINSHTPKEQFLIPTTFSLPDGAGVKLESAAYPEGHDYTLPADPATRLNVFSGEFAIQAKLTATRGDHLVEAKLRYQACDETQCMPPKTITVPIDIVAK
ncbi:protein-disulfide reductase DsbD N-terminal domain-containing protein [Occallatibacter riparius]|uniref:Protein-disulfide reductase DsbD N-terminal domain-containing protein n=1 Tax=Occallatibacter riparius TaxID=1002689 RepID=A0A9J7BYM7_9BACT|nr:protein-disulfide reductase DsbD N-terminal domain-containing protein [Occallatibacter riparius]UWZ86613.1 protein-disulfide reductase DsbD N-terminal domain-containing protein [Occallatibacter riparius]